MKMGSSIAICGIWLSLPLMCFACKEGVIIIVLTGGMFALLGTLIVAAADSEKS